MASTTSHKWALKNGRGEFLSLDESCHVGLCQVEDAHYFRTHEQATAYAKFIEGWPPYDDFEAVELTVTISYN